MIQVFARSFADNEVYFAAKIAKAVLFRSDGRISNRLAVPCHSFPKVVVFSERLGSVFFLVEHLRIRLHFNAGN
jgi:hypothetical protein